MPLYYMVAMVVSGVGELASVNSHERQLAGVLRTFEGGI